METLPQTLTKHETDYGDYANWHTAANLRRAISRDALNAALAGVQLDAGEEHLVELLTEMTSNTVGSAVQLLERCRAGAGRWTAPLDLRADQVDVGWLLLDARTEADYHPVTAVTECEEKHLDYDDCVVIHSTAYREGLAHCPADWCVTVRIPAGEL